MLSVRMTSLGITRANLKSSARMSGRRSSSVSGRVVLSGLTNLVSTLNVFSALSASTRRAAAGLSLWLTTATGIPAGPGLEEFTWNIWPRR